MFSRFLSLPIYALFLSISHYGYASPLAQHIAESYQRMATAQEMFSKDAEAYCKKTPAFNGDKKQLRESWREAMSAWMKAQHIDTGPIVSENLAWTFQFWPDKKNLVKAKVDAFLETTEEITPDKIATTSVIVQGYSALEYVLFDKEISKALLKKQGCEYLMATSKHLQVTIKKLTDYWKDKKNQETLEVNPKKASMVINAVATQIELTHKKIALPLNKNNAFFAESWRSKNSLTNIRDNIVGLSALYTDVIKPWVLKNRNDQLKMREGHQLDLEIQAAFKTIEKLASNKGPISKQIKDNKSNLVLLEKRLKALKVLLGEKLPQFLGIMIGFNSNDGD